MTFIAHIAKSTGLSTSYLEKLVRKAPHSYKHYTIPKRTGGTRDIYHPSAALKAIQIWIAEQFFDVLPVHTCVYSYRKRRNVAMHADQHRSANFLLRIDLKDFFPSITGDDVRRLLSENLDRFSYRLNQEDAKSIARLVCRTQPNSSELALTIGAPSSPAISNAILYKLDSTVDAYCRSLGVVYTRYADDLYFSTSTPGLLEGIEKFVKNSLSDLPYPRLRTNDKKTVFTSRKRRRVVTGITLTSDKKLSVGRETKRELKTLVFLCLKGQLDAEAVGSLRGKLAYIQSVEPGFIDALISKFGADPIFFLLKGNDSILG